MERDGYDPLNPVAIFEGMILDGKLRHKAAIHTGHTPTFTTLPDDIDAEEWLGTRIVRRSIAVSQMADALYIRHGKGQPRAKSARGYTAKELAMRYDKPRR